MGRINVLPDILASQVAAGEVVERPASVVKELVENSIDAGAKRIVVEFQKGGTRLIRVTDDGSGMDRADALLCLERHATSKIRESADLVAITTLGFRGEALPSIASVSRFRLSTRRREDACGTLISVSGGKIHEVEDSGDAAGTRIEVADLFFNVPARRKFLRGEQTETAHLLQQIETLAVAHPEISFICRRDQEEIFRLAATEDLAVRLRDLYGEKFLKRLVVLTPQETQGVRVYGWMARPGEGRSDRSHQLLFVNGRMIRSPLLSQPLREACEGTLAKGLHPPAVLFFEMDPSAVDCNVHPAKREVRFRDPGLIRTVALQAARSAWKSLKPLTDHEFSPGVGTDPLFPPIYSGKSAVHPTWMPSDHSIQCELSEQMSGSSRIQETPVSDDPNSSGCALHQSSLSARYIGMLGGRYLLFEEKESLLLLEIRAARERLLYERFLSRLSQGSLESQHLLMPELLEVSSADLAWIEAHRDLLNAAGLFAESFGVGKHGVGSLKVDAIPADAATLPIMEIVVCLVDELRNIGEAPTLDRRGREVLAATVSRIAAAGASLPDGPEGAMMLLRQLLASELPYVTPKGRPTLIQLAPGELLRRFEA
jgi:DNA mismatch repair protein MutL